MSKWEKVRLGDVARVVSGSTPKTSVKEYWDGEYNWVTPAELNDTSFIIYQTQRKITEKAISDTNLTLLPKGTVLLTSRAPIGKVAIAGVEMYCNQGFKNLICSDVLHNKFLFWYLRGKTEFLNSLGRGATFKEISKSIVENIKIPLPPLEIQKEIAQTLDTASELLALRKQQLAELDNLIKSVFYDMFGDPVINEKGWKVTKLGEILYDVKNGITRRGKEDVKGNIVLRLKDIKENYIDYSDVKKFVLNQRETELFQVLPNQMLFIRVNGNPDFVGRCAVFKGFEQCVYYNDHIMRVTLKEDVINADYLCRLLNFPYGKREIKNQLKTSAGQYTINQQGLSNIAIPLPPLELQNQFADIVSKIEQQKSLVRKAIDETQTLFDSLMSQYFD